MIGGVSPTSLHANLPDTVRISRSTSMAPGWPPCLEFSLADLPQRVFLQLCVSHRLFSRAFCSRSSLSSRAASASMSLYWRRQL